MPTKALPKAQAWVVTAEVGPPLPLLHHPEGAEFPIYTGPLDTARLFVRRDRYLLEFEKYGKQCVFLSADEAGQDCREWSLSFVSREQALREAFGVYFHLADFDSESLRRALRRLIEGQLDALDAAP